MGKHISSEICAYCKGVRRLCGARVCPILLKFDYLKKDITLIKSKEIYVVSPPDFLVGEFGYPSVNMGPISSPESDKVYSFQNYEVIARGGLDLIDILRLRLNTIFSFKKRPVKRVRRIFNELSEIDYILMSVKPVEAEITLKKYPRPRIFLDPDIPPTGLRAPLEKIENVENTLVPKKVYEFVEDDIKASMAVTELYLRDLSIYHIIRIFSGGLLGKKHLRKAVPTRWAITAVDSIIANYFLKNIKRFKELSEALIYTYKHLGNEYIILLIPATTWSMEMFEIWMPLSVWVRRPGKPVLIYNFEDYRGKVEKMDGGYYAIRFGILEHLYKIRRKASAIAVRIIYPEYFAGVGNWQIREGVRLAFSNKPIFKGEFPDAFNILKSFVISKTGVDIESRSKILRIIKTKKLDEFLKKL